MTGKSRRSWHGLKYLNRGFLIADRLRRDIKAMEFGYQKRSARTGSGLDLGDHIVMVGVLLLVDVDPAWGGLRRPIPAAARHVDALEVGVIMHPIHGFRRRQTFNFLAGQAVVDGHLRRDPRADQ